MYCGCNYLFLKYVFISQRMNSVDSFVACQAFQVFPARAYESLYGLLLTTQLQGLCRHCSVSKSVETLEHTRYTRVSDEAFAQHILRLDGGKSLVNPPTCLNTFRNSFSVIQHAMRLRNIVICGLTGSNILCSIIL